MSLASGAAYTRYERQPGIAERSLAAVAAIGSSATLIALLLSLSGQIIAPAGPADRLTTFSIAGDRPQGEELPKVEVTPAAQPPEPSAPQVTRPEPPIAVTPAPLPVLATVASATTGSLPSSALSARDGTAEPARAASPTGVVTLEALGAASPATERSSAQPATGDAYGQAVFQKIRREQRYEQVLQRDGLQGTVVLSFSIDRRGRLRNEHVAIPSGYPIIDRLGLRHLAAAAPFPRPPQGSERSFQIPLTYRKRD